MRMADVKRLPALCVAVGLVAAGGVWRSQAVGSTGNWLTGLGADGAHTVTITLGPPKAHRTLWFPGDTPLDWPAARGRGAGATEVPAPPSEHLTPEDQGSTTKRPPMARGRE
jgi:hypothetical protein